MRVSHFKTGLIQWSSCNPLHPSAIDTVTLLLHLLKDCSLVLSGGPAAAHLGLYTLWHCFPTRAPPWCSQAASIALETHLSQRASQHLSVYLQAFQGQCQVGKQCQHKYNLVLIRSIPHLGHKQEGVICRVAPHPEVDICRKEAEEGGAAD